MSALPRRLSRRGPGRVHYPTNDPLPPEPASDEEREAAMDAKWARYESMVSAQAAGDCTPEGYDSRLDDAGVRSEERETVMRGDE